jgi:hypothetical protein
MTAGIPEKDDARRSQTINNKASAGEIFLKLQDSFYAQGIFSKSIPVRIQSPTAKNNIRVLSLKNAGNSFENVFGEVEVILVQEGYICPGCRLQSAVPVFRHSHSRGIAAIDNTRIFQPGCEFGDIVSRGVVTDNAFKSNVPLMQHRVQATCEGSDVVIGGDAYGKLNLYALPGHEICLASCR